MSNSNQQNFTVEGMSCAACKARIEKAVEQLNGVEQVSVNLLNNSMSVHFDASVCSNNTIIEAVQKSGYKASIEHKQTELNRDISLTLQQREIKFKKIKLTISIVLTTIIMIVAMGPMVGLNLGNNACVLALIQLILCLGVMGLNGNYFTSGFKALFHFSPNMDSLVAIGATASFVYSVYNLYSLPVYATIEYAHHNLSLYFESVATILTLVSVGKYLELRAKNQAVSAISKLYDLAPQYVNVRRYRLSADGLSCEPYEEKIALEQVKVYDEVIVRSGERIGVDGQVIEGKGYVDESAITGESMLVKKVIGSSITSATYLKQGYLVFKVLKVGSDTTLAKIIDLVNNANSQKAPIARLADLVAYYFVPIVLIIAAVTAIVWLQLGAPPSQALSFAVAVLVVSCPCALGLATPTAIMVATGRSASLGVLFRNPEALENLHKVDIMVFDKTGTLTKGQMDVVHVDFDTNADIQECKEAILALEKRSEHPIARAIVKYFESKDFAFERKPLQQVESKVATDIKSIRGIAQKQEDEQDSALGSINTFETVINEETVAQANQEQDDVSDFIAYEGLGLEIKIRGHRYFIGSSFYISKNLFEQRLPSNELLEYEKEGYITIHFFDETRYLATIALGDEVKPSASAVVEQIRHLNIRPIIVSGDSLSVVSRIAQKVGIQTFKSNCLPADKTLFIDNLQRRGSTVAMVGDGINDAPSLTKANVGISVSGASDIASASASVVLMRPNMTNLVSALVLSHMTIRNIKENLFWAFIYNIICIPLAAGVLYPYANVSLDPMIAALLMSLSSVCVVSNALRLRKQPLSMNLGGGKHLLVKEHSHHDDKLIDIIDETQSTQDNMSENTNNVVDVKSDKHKDVLESSLNQDISDKDIVQEQETILKADIDNMQNLELTSLNQATVDNPCEVISHKVEGELNTSINLGENNMSAAKLIHISGMSCQHCVRSVTKVLSALEGSQDLEVDLEKKSARLKLSTNVTDAQIIQCISEEGFEVTGIETLKL